MPTVVMPRLSDSMEEGTIIRWLFSAGDEVQRGSEIVEIETDKATMSYEAEQAGRLEIIAAEGSTLAVGTEIARILGDGEEAAAPAAAEPAPATATATANGSVAAPPAERVAVPVGRVASERVNASPLARRVAASLGVDLASLAGTGYRGRVVKRDVEVATSPATVAAEPVAPDAPAPPATPAAAESAKGTTTTQDASRIQQLIARRMAEAKATMPEFTLTTDVDMDAAVELRTSMKETGDGKPPSYNDFVIKACALALARHPKANGSYRDTGFELYSRVNIGMAVAADDALLVPTIFDADKKSVGEIARTTRELAAKAREGSLTPPELAGGTFSVSNLGMFGVTQFTAVLNPPQAAILAVGALEERAVVKNGEVVPAHRMTITLTSDHRILYGADAAEFLAEIRGLLEQPLRLAL
jgi:pyruvate dehydrogenase E2 component (dihydrolipoamide acetyltransferase)